MVSPVTSRYVSSRNRTAVTDEPTTTAPTATYQALTIDTQTIQSQGFHFDRGLLALIGQFKSGPIKVLISRIVVLEVLRHLEAKTSAAKDALDRALRDAQEFGIPASPGADHGENRPTDAKQIAETRLTAYLSAIGAEIIEPDNVSTAELVRRYFAPAPPFSPVGKKNEFPDAIALMSLDAIGKERGWKILAVSGDKDWSAYGHKSDIIDVQPQLGEALEILQRHVGAAKAAVQKALRDMMTDDNGGLHQAFESYLDREIENTPIDGEASSSYQIEVESVQMTLKKFAFGKTREEYDFSIVKTEVGVIVAEVEMQIDVSVNAEISFSVYDSVDKDIVPMGSSSIECENIELSTSALITFLTDPDEGVIDMNGLELTGLPSSVDLGDVEPSYHEEEVYDPD
jgi:hypothetical protein